MLWFVTHWTFQRINIGITLSMTYMTCIVELYIAPTRAWPTTISTHDIRGKLCAHSEYRYTRPNVQQGDKHLLGALRGVKSLCRARFSLRHEVSVYIVERGVVGLYLNLLGVLRLVRRRRCDRRPLWLHYNDWYTGSSWWEVLLL